MAYVLLALIVFVVALMPIFGPPVWIVLVVAKFRWNLNPVALVGIGAVSAAVGRTTLALVSSKAQRFIPARARDNFESAHEFFERHKWGPLAIFFAFVVSPLPSGQLFVAAGLMKVRLIPLALAFFVGRTISYSGYVAAATVARYETGDILAKVWGKPWMIAFQIVFLLAIVVLPLMPWKKGSRVTS